MVEYKCMDENRFRDLAYRTNAGSSRKRKTPRKKIVLITIAVIAVLSIGAFIFKNKIGAINIPFLRRANNPGDVADIPNDPTTTASKNPTNDPLIAKLSIPDGFSMQVFAKNVKDARVIVFDPKGRMLVSQTSEGRVSIVDSSQNRMIISGLSKPHGLAFLCKNISSTDAATAPTCTLFIAQQSKLVSYDYDVATAAASNPKKLIDIPSTATDRHFTRTLQLLPDNNILLISVGSSCNVCVETDTMRGRIMAYNIATGKVSEYARGLRNSVFMTLDKDGQVFASEMGRDSLGDDIPPDEINIIAPGKDYGWPYCYGQNVHDDVFDTKTYIRNPCMEPFEVPSLIDLPAHSAPLGIAFVPDDWNKNVGNAATDNFTGNLLVAFHGSWNRTTPTGYKIARIAFDSNGKEVSVTDFISGWLTTDGGKLGRPVALVFGPDNALYISDDSTGNVYRVVKN